eukprot:COSAG05_NODE_194_length_14555_cov_25.382955_4_plen_821_part_00
MSSSFESRSYTRERWPTQSLADVDGVAGRPSTSQSGFRLDRKIFNLESIGMGPTVRRRGRGIPMTAPHGMVRGGRSALTRRPFTQQAAGSPGPGSPARSTPLESIGMGLNASTWEQKHETIGQSLDSALGISASLAPSQDQGDLRKFRSIALYAQLKLSELLKQDAARSDSFGAARPTVAKTAVCAHILQEIASVPSAFHDVLQQVTDVMLASVYSDQLMSGSIDMCERVPFFDIVERLQAEKDEWAAKAAELSAQLQEVEHGRRTEAQGGLTLRQKCDGLARDASKWKNQHAGQQQRIRELEDKCHSLEEALTKLQWVEKQDAPVLESQDHVLLSKLKRATADYKRAAVQVQQVQYQLQFMVPRTMLEEITVERDRLEKELKEMTLAHRVLSLKFKKAFSDLMELRKKESERTPRPDWKAAVELTDSAMDLDISSHSTAGLVPVLCKKIAHLSREVDAKNHSGIELNQLRSILDGTDDNVELVGRLLDGTHGKYTLEKDPESPTHFIAHGIDLRVPRFLRQEGRVRNRNFKKSEIDKLVKTFWTQKATYDEVQIKSGKPVESMAEYIFIHFMKIYGKDQSVVSEWTYSILDGLERYMEEEPHFRLFKHVCLNDFAEETYLDEQKMVDSLEIAIQGISSKAKSGKKTQYVCSFEQLEEMLRKFFPMRKTSDFTRIQKLLLRISQENKGRIKLEHLYGSGRDLGKTEFLKLIKKQYVQEIMALLQDLDNELRLRAEPGTNETQVRVRDFRAALVHVDRRGSKDKIESWIEDTLCSPRHIDPLPAATAIKDNLVVDIDDLMRAGRMVFIQPTDQWVAQDPIE